MNFAESTQYLFSLGNEVSAMKLGLENIRKLLAALGNPQNNYLKVQVAGTNGKGSVCAFLDSICNSAGIKTGTFTSPHLVSITERIRINGRDIREEVFARHAHNVRETAEKLLAAGELEYRPTFFEQITAIALVAFADADADLAILETGLGGRLDATTAANAEIAVITRIDLDHQEYLGETIEEIASEKAAIITDQTACVVTGSQADSVKAVLNERCQKVSVVPFVEKGYSAWTVIAGEENLVDIDLTLAIYPSIELGLKGRHQLENAQTAIQVAQALIYEFVIFSYDDHEHYVIEGLKSANHPGRLEYQGKYLFDGAHNVSGVKALVEYLDEFEKRPITLIFGAMREKNVTEILDMLTPRAERVIVTESANTRSLSYNELLAKLPVSITRERTFVTDSVANAVEIADTVTPDNGIILVTGSLYLVGEVKKILQFQI